MRKIKNNLEMDFMILRKWFQENHMILKPGKCDNIVIGDNDLSYKIILNNDEITGSSEENLLGILLDSKLNLDSHITSLSKKAGQKLSALLFIFIHKHIYNRHMNKIKKVKTKIHKTVIKYNATVTPEIKLKEEQLQN